MDWTFQGRILLRACTLSAAAVLAASCGGGGDDEGTLTGNSTAPTTTTTTPAPTTTPTTTAPPSGGPPAQISGTPATVVQPGEMYVFKPQATGSPGAKLTFAISNRPRWLRFDAWDGALYGVPSSADAGVYSRVTITVGDGRTTAALNPFDIQVRTKSGGPPVGANGAVTLGLTAPTENIDGAPLTDLAGYRIYWGTAPGQYSYSAKLDNPGLTSYLVERLSATTWYFVATAVNSQGVESEFSDVLAVTL